jgi:hypothetical protein
MLIHLIQLPFLGLGFDLVVRRTPRIPSLPSAPAPRAILEAAATPLPSEPPPSGPVASPRPLAKCLPSNVIAFAPRARKAG